MKNNTITQNEMEKTFIGALRTRKEVRVFGQLQENTNFRNMDDVTLFDTLDILKELHSQANEVYDVVANDMYDHDIINTLEELYGAEEVNHINTYNWSSPISNDLDFKVFNSDDSTFLYVNVQNGYGDIRSGYLLSFIFEFDLVEDWIYLFEDISYKGFSIDNLSFEFSLFGESGVFDVYDHENSEDVEYDVYIGDFEDCKDYTVNYNKELKKEEV